MTISRRFKKNLGFNLIFLVSILIFIFVVISFSKDFVRIREVNDEINDIETQITQLQDDNIELDELLQYFDSDSYAEQKARSELGLKKEGENVVVINRDDNLTENIQPIDISNNPSNNRNLKKWWDYLFKRN